jgi:alpha-beta hydrolase superfamily lysophospholipase
MVHAWQPGLPMYLFGHSLGGLIGAIYLLDYQNDLKGAILSSPAIKIPDYVTPPTIVLGKILSTLAPKVGLIGLDARSISRDQTVVQEYINDPLVTTGKTTARLASEMLRSMQRVGAEASKINLPIMIVHGSEDKLINPDASHLLYELVSSQDKTLNIYDGFYHEVFNEPEHAQVLLDMESWLDRQLDQKDNRYENLYQR